MPKGKLHRVVDWFIQQLFNILLTGLTFKRFLINSSLRLKLHVFSTHLMYYHMFALTHHLSYTLVFIIIIKLDDILVGAHVFVTYFRATSEELNNTHIGKL